MAATAADQCCDAAQGLVDNKARRGCLHCPQALQGLSHARRRQPNDIEVAGPHASAAPEACDAVPSRPPQGADTRFCGCLPGGQAFADGGSAAALCCSGSERAGEPGVCE